MKSKLLFIAILLIVLLAAIFVVVGFSDLLADVESSMSSTPSGGSQNNTNEEDEDMSLLMTMQDPLYRSPVEGVDGIRFPVKYSNYFKETVLNEEGVTLHCLVVPVDLLEEAGVDVNGVPVDYVKAVQDAGVNHVIIDGSDAQASYDAGRGNWIGYFGLTNIKTENTNRDMFAIAYVQYVNGVREYAGLPVGETVASMARSYAYVCAEALAKHSMGEYTYSEAAVTKLKTALSNSAYVAAGKEVGETLTSPYRINVDKDTEIQEDDLAGGMLVLQLQKGTSHSCVLEIVNGADKSAGVPMLPIMAETSKDDVVSVSGNVIIADDKGGTVDVTFYCGAAQLQVKVVVS